MFACLVPSHVSTTVPFKGVVGRGSRTLARRGGGQPEAKKKFVT